MVLPAFAFYCLIFSSLLFFRLTPLSSSSLAVHSNTSLFDWRDSSDSGIRSGSDGGGDFGFPGGGGGSDGGGGGFHIQWSCSGGASGTALEAAQVQLVAAAFAAPGLIEVAPMLVQGVPSALARVYQTIQALITSSAADHAIPAMVITPPDHPVPSPPLLLRLRGGGDDDTSSSQPQASGSSSSSVCACPCVGWRISGTSHAPWYSCLGAHRLYDLDKGGIISPEDFFLVYVQPQLPSQQSYTSWVQQKPERQGLIDAAASSLQSQHSGLYIGMKDSVRSTMCVRDGGQKRLSGMCVACFSLSKNKSFRRRCARAASSYHLDLSNVNLEYLTRAELMSCLQERHHQSRVSGQRELRVREAAASAAKTSDELIATANARAEIALKDARLLLEGMRVASEAATDAERKAVVAHMALVQAVQEHSEQQVSLPQLIPTPRETEAHARHRTHAPHARTARRQRTHARTATTTATTTTATTTVFFSFFLLSPPQPLPPQPLPPYFFLSFHYHRRNHHRRNYNRNHHLVCRPTPTHPCAQESLQAMALATMAIQEQLEMEHDARVLAEAEACAATVTLSKTKQAHAVTLSETKKAHTALAEPKAPVGLWWHLDPTRSAVGCASACWGGTS
jgi:hypothetical protein